jgi:hypothetical protein
VAELFIHCPNCNTPAASGTAFCGNCGTPIPEVAGGLFIRCPICGAQTPSESAFCGNCGRPVTQAVTSEPMGPPRQPTKRLLLPPASVGGCENCGATDIAEDGSCRACRADITQVLPTIPVPSAGAPDPAQQFQAAVTPAVNQQHLPPAATRRGDFAPPPDIPSLSPEPAFYVSDAAERTTAFTPPSGQHAGFQAGGPPPVGDLGGRRPNTGLIAIVAIALLVGVTGVGFGLTRNNPGAPTPGTANQVAPTTSPAPAPSPTPDATSPTSLPIPAPSPTANASLQQLQALVQSDAPFAASEIDGRWVAMLSSKTAGTVDPLQTTASGSHTFGWADILSETLQLQEDPRFTSPVFLMMSTSFGLGVTRDGKPLFVTATDDGFANADAVRTWCDATFPELGQAQRNDACAPAQLTPPS